MYLSTIADATTFRKVALILEAKARASSVLPVPGGPYRRTPLGAYDERGIIVEGYAGLVFSYGYLETVSS